MFSFFADLLIFNIFFSIFFGVCVKLFHTELMEAKGQPLGTRRFLLPGFQAEAFVSSAVLQMQVTA